MGDTINGAVSKSAQSITKTLASKLDAAAQARTLLTQGQSALQAWKQNLMQQLHGKFSTLNDITATIHRFNNWMDEDDPDVAYLWRRSLNL